MSLETHCHYLFGAEAEAIFQNVKFENVPDKRRFIDHCLEITMRINVYLLTYKETFFAIDPMCFNNQCHLYALRAAQIKMLYPSRSAEAKTERSPDNRFLHLAFFLSFTLIRDTEAFVKVIIKVCGELNIPFPSPRKQFMAFLRDDGRFREKAARPALIQLLAASLREKFASLQAVPLYQELLQIASEDLNAAPSHGGDKKQVYSYPKLSGVAYMVDTLSRENIPFLFKVKVITPQGSPGIIQKGSAALVGKQPVLVFEAIMTQAVTPAYVREEAKRCPSYYFRHPLPHNRHAAAELCLFCKSIALDLEPFRQRLNQLMVQPVERLFYALGVDFMRSRQPQFLGFFQNDEKYPRLSANYAKALPAIAELKVGMEEMTSFTICHSHCNSAEQAALETMLLDRPPVTVLQEAGLL